jgi:glycosyltransferase involved in cell wall biosynthesis
MRVLFLIRGLYVGGAERQLVTLARALRERGHHVSVAIFYGGGPLETELVEANVNIIYLNKTGRWDVAGFLFRFAMAIRRESPDLLHSYMGPANLITVLFKSLFRKVPIVWGVRASNLDLNQYDWLARAVFRAECFLSRFADLIICNSSAGLDYAAQHGFPRSKSVVIPNGIDPNRFAPQPQDRAPIRSSWSVRDDETLIGLVARFDPMKDHETFIEAASLLATRIGKVRFVLVGGGTARAKEKLVLLTRALDVERIFIWAGIRRDMPSIYSALDIATSSSCSEGFPNAVAEAMACGVPCVVTDAGDSRWIVGEDDLVVPIRDPNAMASAWVGVLKGSRVELSARAQVRIAEHFSAAKLVETTENLFTNLLMQSKYTRADKPDSLDAKRAK